MVIDPTDLDSRYLKILSFNKLVSATPNKLYIQDAAGGNAALDVYQFSCGYFYASVIRGSGTNTYLQSRAWDGAHLFIQAYLGGWKPMLEFFQDKMYYRRDLDCDADDSIGLILKDRTTGTKYRLYVDSGVLSIEAV